ncbi:MAG: hypothetical protein GY757_18965 [bacterium]|nr:hypothetical protein [bacterium]
MQNNCPAHLYRGFVIDALNDHHGLLGCGEKLVKKYQYMLQDYWYNGHSPEECAYDMHHKWMNKKHVCKPANLRDHLKSGACLGIYKFKED